MHKIVLNNYRSREEQKERREEPEMKDFPSITHWDEMMAHIFTTWQVPLFTALEAKHTDQAPSRRLDTVYRASENRR